MRHSVQVFDVWLSAFVCGPTPTESGKAVTSHTPIIHPRRRWIRRIVLGMSRPSADVSSLTEEQQSILQQYTSITNQDAEAAIPLLQRSQWNVQVRHAPMCSRILYTWKSYSKVKARFPCHPSLTRPPDSNPTLLRWRAHLRSSRRSSGGVPSSRHPPLRNPHERLLRSFP